MNARNSFVPRLERLEDRCQPSGIGISQPGALAVQLGSTLSVLVSNATLTTTVIVEDGQGDMAVSVNSSPFHVFTGINTINVSAQGRNNAVVLWALAPLQTPEQLNLRLIGVTSALLQHLPPGGVPLTVRTNPTVPIIPI